MFSSLKRTYNLKGIKSDINKEINLIKKFNKIFQKKRLDILTVFSPFNDLEITTLKNLSKEICEIQTKINYNIKTLTPMEKMELKCYVKRNIYQHIRVQAIKQFFPQSILSGFICFRHIDDENFNYQLSTGTCCYTSLCTCRYGIDF